MKLERESERSRENLKVRNRAAERWWEELREKEEHWKLARCTCSREMQTRATEKEAEKGKDAYR